MTLDDVVKRYVDGNCGEVAGLNVHDAVHVLASVHQLSKPELRAAIYKAMLPTEEEDAVEPEKELEWWTTTTTPAAVEGGDA